MRLMFRAGAISAAVAASVAAAPALLVNSAEAIDLKSFIPKQVFVKQANPTSVAILSIQGSSNTSKGVMCDVTYTSAALYPNVTTSKAGPPESLSSALLAAPSVPGLLAGCTPSRCPRPLPLPLISALMPT